MTRRYFLEINGLALASLITKPIWQRFSPVPVQKQTILWAMAIDLKECTAAEGCTSCRDACHKIHNVPAFPNHKDEISWLRLLPADGVFPEQDQVVKADSFKKRLVTVLCNHCENAPCVRVCPTGATWKRTDGIVMMDYHRCIGCRYCMAACPYGSRSFNWRDPRTLIKEISPGFPTRMKGVVEKCNFCEERLIEYKLPACVEACVAKAMFFGNLSDSGSEISRLLHSRFSIVRKPALGTRPKVYYIP